MVYGSIKYLILRSISISGILTSVYFAISPSFRREQRALVHGLLKHMRDIKEPRPLFLMRRNVHRLEKGLLMPNRRKLFALKYIGETVEFYKNCLENEPKQQEISSEMAWATAVLNKYFEVVGSDSLVEKAREEYLKVRLHEEKRMTPYKRGEPQSPVSYEDLLSLCYQRKSIRKFLDKPVPHDLIDKALEIANRAPSSSNRQPVRYRFYDQKPLLSELQQLPIGASGFRENIPMICAVTGDMSAYFFERDRHSIFVDCSLSSMLFMLALETVGLSSCPLNWPEIDFRDRNYEKLSGLPPYERAVMFLAIGYADPEGSVAYSGKKDIEHLRSYNLQNPQK